MRWPTYNTKQYAEAINAYKEGVRLKPDNATALYNLGWSYNELKQYANALAAANEAIRLKADYPEAYNERGYAKRKLGEEAPKGSSI